MNKESRVHTFYLRHSDISTTTTSQSVSNAVGSWSNYKQSVSWNVDLKQILGSDWDKYETFRIHINQFTYSNVNYGATGSELLWHSFISGLNFKNSSYNSVTKNHSNRATLFTHNVGNTFNGSVFYPNPFYSYFTKGDALVRLQMDHFRITDGLPVTSTTGLPHSVFVFEICGIE